MAQKEFIEKIAPLIQAEARARGYRVASPIIAQACVESRHGESLLGHKYHNYFGMKCGSSWKGKSVNLKTKEEYKISTLTTIRDNFRAYDSMEEGVKGYFDFISSKRYANLKDAASAREYLERIKADGYATSSTYVSTNMAVVDKYGLTKYDRFAERGASERAEKEECGMPTIKRGSEGKAVSIWQIVVDVRCDGIFGASTEQATKSFQAEHKLTSDGVVGPKSWKAGLESID